MKCPNCKSEFSKGNRCPNCRIDTALYMRILQISNSHFNQGLERVKIHDLSGAQTELIKSVEYNKANVNSRNLLGLIYFETGRIGDAVSNWVLSASYVKNDNLASYYLDMLQKNSKAAERLNEAVLTYNRALSYLEQESEDLAVIQLKRSLDLNPKFVDAMNLLSLCYLTKNDREKAKQIIERVLEIDTGNAVAHRYYLEAFGKTWGDKQPVRQPGSRFDASRLESNDNSLISKTQYTSMKALSIKNEKSFRNNFHIPEIITFIVGAICTVAVFYVLILPGKIEKLQGDLATANELMQTNEQTMNDTIIRKNSEINDLTYEINSLKSRIEIVESEKGDLERIQRVSQVESVFGSGNLDETIALLAEIDPSRLPADVVERYELIKAEAYPQYAKQMYDAGINSYNDGVLSTADTQFEACLRYAGGELGLADQAIYMLGRMADESGNTEQALVHYQKIVDEFPNSVRISTVNDRLAELRE